MLDLKRYFSVFVTALFVLLSLPAFATPAIPVDHDKFSIGNTITAELTAYGVKAQHTGYKEDNKNAKIFYTRQGTADPAPEVLARYTNPDSAEYHTMLEEIRKELNFTSLHFHRLDDMLEAMDIDPCRLCTYCWNGRE